MVKSPFSYGLPEGKCIEPRFLADKPPFSYGFPMVFLWFWHHQIPCTDAKSLIHKGRTDAGQASQTLAATLQLLAVGWGPMLGNMNIHYVFIYIWCIYIYNVYIYIYNVYIYIMYIYNVYNVYIYNVYNVYIYIYVTMCIYIYIYIHVDGPIRVCLLPFILSYIYHTSSMCIRWLRCLIHM